MRTKSGRPPRRVGLAIGTGILAMIALVSVFAPWVAPYDPNLQSVEGFGPEGGPLGPNSHYLLGTDAKGRDLLSRLIFGGRVTFFACVIAVVIATAIGLTIGLAAAAQRGWIGGTLMRATDIGLAIPGLLLAAAIAQVLGPGITSLTVALTVVFWAPLARVTYGQAVVIRERQFVEASRAMGATTLDIMFHQIVPNIFPVVAAYAALCVGWAALFESALGFLGLGIQEPTSSIGSMIGSGIAYYRLHPGLIVFPTLYLGALVMATTLIGEALRKPRERSVVAAPIADYAPLAR